MCTAISYKTNDHYFGRNLDLEHQYSETVTITPRNYEFEFRESDNLISHYAMIGMATVVDNYPLYYDATNECGLSMAGLNFPGNAIYLPSREGSDNITPFEFIPWILGKCKNINETKQALSRLNLINVPYSRQFPLTPLHWIISDRESSIVVEPFSDGIHIYENPVGVLTNNPSFDFHLQNLSNYLNLTREDPVNHFSREIDIEPYSRGMGAIGLPGDLSSASRFIRATFTKLNSVTDKSEFDSISQFFHILSSVAQQRGCVRVGDSYEITIYSSCCNTDRGIYYYTTYGNNQISAINLHNVNLDRKDLILYPLIMQQQIYAAN